MLSSLSSAWRGIGSRYLTIQLSLQFTLPLPSTPLRSLRGMLGLLITTGCTLHYMKITLSLLILVLIYASQIQALCYLSYVILMCMVSPPIPTIKLLGDCDIIAISEHWLHEYNLNLIHKFRRTSNFGYSFSK